MIYTITDLRTAYQKGQHIKYLFFWGHTPPADGSVNQSCLSQWWKQDFTIDNLTYSCAEQYMMAEKARLFHDNEALEKIIAAKHPKEMKAFGRAVRNFDQDIWAKHCSHIVVTANKAKFSQNEDLKAFLLATKNRILVEASPRDRIWGIGMGKSNPDAENPMKWRGQNLLGFALTRVRDKLIKELEE